MNLKNKKKWIEALRSGDYEQSAGVLHAIDEQGNDSFCCLGVACKLYEEDGDIQVDRHAVLVRYDGYKGILPDAVLTWLGTKTAMGEYIHPDGKTGSLISLNDTGSTFDEIADVLEEVELR
jgi:hypothetical protein